MNDIEGFYFIPIFFFTFNHDAMFMCNSNPLLRYFPNLTLLKDSALNVPLLDVFCASLVYCNLFQCQIPHSIGISTPLALSPPPGAVPQPVP